MAHALLMGPGATRWTRGATQGTQAMNTQTESLYDAVLFALGPVVLGYAVGMVALLVAYARP
ncbi:hypothetical protein MFU01_21290 [Myxococcus fulvus]|uniref:Uncharacterized protein n=2 Tax=Myxococcus fulvus TaxID=33 RepID=A0A511T0A1_MYXFU|nr:hypothetical protein MFU01_21290 [Myxococcus fulvus]